MISGSLLSARQGYSKYILAHSGPSDGHSTIPEFPGHASMSMMLFSSPCKILVGVGLMTSCTQLGWKIVPAQGIDRDLLVEPGQSESTAYLPCASAHLLLWLCIGHGLFRGIGRCCLNGARNATNHALSHADLTLFPHPYFLCLSSFPLNDLPSIMKTQ
jgi:hypothetical protein